MIFPLFSDVITGPSVLLWLDQTYFPTPARAPTNTWKSNMNVYPTVCTPPFSHTPNALLSPSHFLSYSSDSRRKSINMRALNVPSVQKYLRRCHPVLSSRLRRGGGWFLWSWKTQRPAWLQDTLLRVSRTCEGWYSTSAWSDVHPSMRYCCLSNVKVFVVTDKSTTLFSLHFLHLARQQLCQQCAGLHSQIKPSEGYWWCNFIGIYSRNSIIGKRCRFVFQNNVSNMLIRVKRHIC